MNNNLPKLISSKALQRMFKLAPSSFYRIVPARSHELARGMIPVAWVVEYLNCCRVNLPELSAPMPLLSEKEVAPLFDIDGRPATPVQVRRFCRRSLFPIPHFDLGAGVKRFPPMAVEWWLSNVGSGTRVSSRRFRYDWTPPSRLIGG